MQYDLRLIQLLLDFHDAVRLLWILILLDVLFKLGKGKCGIGIRKGGAWVSGEKFIDHFGEELMGNEGGVVGVTDYYACDAFGATVGVECVG